MESCEDDVQLAHEVLQDFRETAPSCLIRLAAAVTAADASLVRLEAHSLKGSSRTIGAQALAGAAVRLETAAASNDLSDAPSLLALVEIQMPKLISFISGYLAS